MPQGPKVSFVVFPDGKIDESSLTVSGERNARIRCVRAWLIPDLFGDAADYVVDSLWRHMSQKGFKSYTIEMAGEFPQLAED